MDGRVESKEGIEICNLSSTKLSYVSCQCCVSVSEAMPMAAIPDPDFRAQLIGFSLTTAEILYRMPDHPSLLQSFIWQEYDVHPRFPRLKHFLDFWSRNLDGKLYRVTVAHKRLITPAELRLVGNEFRVH
jgi:uncharacterized protein Usg